jgi:hypothetical protein
MIHWRPLYKGSKNPPVNQQVLLKANDGTWGVGFMYKDKTFYYYATAVQNGGRTWMGISKERFTDWALITT